MFLALLAAFAAIAVAHLCVELTLLGGSFASAGEIRALITLATRVSLLSTAFAVATTAATSTTASTTSAAFATRTSVLRTVATFEIRRRRFIRAGVLGNGCADCRGGAGSGLLFALAFTLALTLCLAFRFAGRIALARWLVALCLWFALRFALGLPLRFTRRLRGGIAIAAMFAMTVTATRFLVTIASGVLVAIAVAAMRAAVAITSTVAIATVPGTATVTVTMTVAMPITVSVTSRFGADRRLLGGLGSGCRTRE